MYFISCNFKHISCHFELTTCNSQLFFSDCDNFEFMSCNFKFTACNSDFFITLLSDAYFVGKITKDILSVFNFLFILNVVNEEYMFGNMEICFMIQTKPFFLQNRQVIKPKLAIRSTRRTLVSKQLNWPVTLLIFIYLYLLIIT